MPVYIEWKPQARVELVVSPGSAPAPPEASLGGKPLASCGWGAEGSTAAGSTAAGSRAAGSAAAGSAAAGSTTGESSTLAIEHSRSMGARCWRREEAGPDLGGKRRSRRLRLTVGVRGALAS
jgi:hypothetical protein